MLFGVNLDWKSETLDEHRANMGHAPAVAVEFSDIPYDRPTWEHTKSAARQIKQNGGALLLTLEPHGGLDTVSPEVIRTLAYDLLDLNNSGVAVVVRFAHEMNGSWYAWGQQPDHYKAVFRQVADAVHQIAPGSAMMWAPNYGGGYPFSGGKFAAAPGTEVYHELDTDHDGVLTMADDSYEPYYPGDAYVDWVGVSLYHWGNRRPWGNNEVTEPHKFIDMLTGTYDGTAGDDRGVPDFYQVYGVDHHKPVAIVETAAIFTPSRTGQSELAVKQAWWREVFSAETRQRFPQLKMINWFEWRKFEIEINDWVDWRTAGAPAIKNAFVADLPGWLRYADSVDACE
ncbi:glycoside hydrolase family 26 protein [Mycolicibacterium cosmeticum]|uniref:glycoside hydrolase family 26 protein n=1 Tax=Mycolicibacterium cosmeticum TaxID=258533 RepID=UPI001F3F893B|nr:glycosyl hydrolase [Mycolicibacterium cosmeticum]